MADGELLAESSNTIKNSSIQLGEKAVINGVKGVEINCGMGGLLIDGTEWSAVEEVKAWTPRLFDSKTEKPFNALTSSGLYIKFKEIIKLEGYIYYDINNGTQNMQKSSWYIGDATNPAGGDIIPIFMNTSNFYGCAFLIGNEYSGSTVTTGMRSSETNFYSRIKLNRFPVDYFQYGDILKFEILIDLI